MIEWYVYALASAILAALSGAVEKKALLHEHSLSFSAGHAIVIFLLSLPLLIFANLSALTPHVLAITFFGAVLSAIAFWFTIRGVKHLDLSIASQLTVSTLAFVPILAFFTVGERLSFRQISGIALIFLGVIALEYLVHNSKKFKIISDKHAEKYIPIVLIGGLLFSITSVVDKAILEKIDIFTYLVLVHLFMAIGSIMVMILLRVDFKKELKTIFKQDPKQILLASLLTLAYRYALFASIATSFVSEAIAIKRLSILFSTIIGGKLFHEKNLPQKLLICLIMLAGALLLIFS